MLEQPHSADSIIQPHGIIAGHALNAAGVYQHAHGSSDPTHAFLAPGIRAWRLVEGVSRPWEPDADGRWQSAEIAVAIGLEGTLATVYTRAGERQLRVGEVADELARLRGEVERLRRLLDARQGAQG